MIKQQFAHITIEKVNVENTKHQATTIPTINIHSYLGWLTICCWIPVNHVEILACLPMHQTWCNGFTNSD